MKVIIFLIKAQEKPIDYETNLQLLDEILETQPEEYEPYLSIFGKNGKMVRKIIKTPYDLNPNNYIYMVIPNLNHIKSVQNNRDRRCIC